ncbi:uncharacterized protein LOC110434851 [Sorghum bicolor]|uniref:uncharacterized protein LOC110434851 n=1 Tax=Sorghum bicolor TaxID=4558 RepID=UPI000B425AFF|nr:uncharacterized protein LOC110434851 [Sorghum bicolor]|eukprot:XP_021315282.1 uncharacterized protein LOC110434851 [Sorghum bicolor]
MRSRAPAARTIVFRLPRCERSGHRGKVGRGGQPEPTAAVSARDSVIPPHAPAARASETPFSLAGVRSVRQPNLTVEGLGRLTVSSLNIVIDRWVCSRVAEDTVNEALHLRSWLVARRRIGLNGAGLFIPMLDRACSTTFPAGSLRMYGKCR